MNAASEMLACCQSNHIMVGPVVHGLECLFICKNCDRDYYQVATAIYLGPEDDWEIFGT